MVKFYIKTIVFPLPNFRETLKAFSAEKSLMKKGGVVKSIRTHLALND